MMTRPLAVPAAFFFLLSAAPALGADGSMAIGGDMVADWLHFLFYPASTTGSDADSLSAIAAALGRALRVYGSSMFIIAGFLLFWQIATMLAETAQTGVFLGQRANKLWAPIRFAIGITLLIPLGSGLCLGQHLIVKMAEKGSSLASEAWRDGLTAFGAGLSAPLIPRLAGTERLLYTSTQMALCQTFYRTLVTVYEEDPIVSFAGGMEDFTRTPATLVQDETWRLSNTFFPETPLCGAYHFISQNQSSTGTPTLPGLENKETAILAHFARSQAEKTFSTAQNLVLPLASAFLPSTIKDVVSPPDLTTAFAGAFAENDKAFGTFLQDFTAQARMQTAAATLNASAQRGWLAAGALPFDISRQQIMLGELLSYALPTVTAPLLGHTALDSKAWHKAADEKIGFGLSPEAKWIAYDRMFDQLSEAMKRTRHWLDAQMKGQEAILLPDQQDLRDALGPLSDSQTAQNLLSRLVTHGATAFGVFSLSDTSPRGAQEQRNYLTRPLQTLAETGRRSMSYGTWMMGLLSPALSETSTVGAALFFFFFAGLFWISGAGLAFAAPLIPFLKFALAALDWGLAILGAILSLPLVALAHLSPSGEGLVGPVARRAYWLWLGLFLRPAFILAGFLGGLALFLLGVMFLNLTLFDWLAPLANPQSQVFWIFRSSLTLFHALAVLVLANVAFRGVTTFPRLLTQWIDARSQVEAMAITPAGAEVKDRPFYMPTALSHSVDATVRALTHRSSHRQLKETLQTTETSPSKNLTLRSAQSAQFPLTALERGEREAALSPTLPSGARASAHASASLIGEKGKVGAVAAAESGSGVSKAGAIARQMMPLDSDLQGKKEKQLDTSPEKPPVEPPKEKDKF